LRSGTLRQLVLSEQPFRILLGFFGNVASLVKFNLCTNEEDNMKKLGYVIAALATIAIAAPSIASAETIVVEGGHHRDHGWHRDHWHPHHHDMMVMRHRHHHDY
jgi:hypothetical protein